MASKKLISVVAASVLVATFSLTGCGSSSSSAPVTTNVTVSDGYALGATVTATDYTGQAVEQGKGVYQFPGTITGALTATGGINDVDNDGVKDAGEPYLPILKAPAAYKNVNPFTTIIASGDATAAQLISFLGVNASDVNNNFDFDIVAKAKTNPKIARGAALMTAVVSQVAYNTAHPSSSSSSSVASSTGVLPTPGSSGATSSVASSITSSVSSSGGTLPVPFGILPEPGTSSVASSITSSVASSSSSSTPVITNPINAIITGSSTVCSALPTLCALDTAIQAVTDADIAANGMKSLDALTQATLGSNNGVVVASSASSAAVSSSSSSVSDVPPSPGDIPGGSSSSSVASSVASSNGGTLPFTILILFLNT